MAYADNPFAPVKDKEAVVMNHFKTVLNRLSPEVEQSVITSLSGQEMPTLGEWTRERETTDPAPATVHMIGLSKYPPNISLSDLEPRSDGGPIDLYNEVSDVALAIEGKTKEPLRESQLARYVTALDADSLTTASWTDVYRVLSNHRQALDPYPAGIVADFLEYLELAELYKPSYVAEYFWGDEDGASQIRVEGGNELQVVWRVDDFEKSREIDNRKVPWDVYCELFEDIEERHGRDLIRRVFVNAERFDQQPELDGDTVVGQTNAIRTSDENYLRLNYHEDEGALKLREVNPPKSDTLGSPAGGGERYCWYVTPSELQGVLTSGSDTDGFSHDFRQTLFLNRDRKAVESHIW